MALEEEISQKEVGEGPKHSVFLEALGRKFTDW